MAKRRVLLDTDIGSDVDDALALALILACPESLELVGVTTVSSDTHLRARIAARLLGIAGRPDVETCAGARDPLVRPAHGSRFRHEERCFSEGPDAPIGSESGPERIVRAASEVEGLELVAIGPLTNVARALALDRELPRRVAGLTVMGGHIREVRIGDFVADHGIDYNLCSDPEAAVSVLGAGFDVTLVTADVTLRTWLLTRELEALERGGAFARALAQQVRLWSPVQRELFTGLGGQVAPDNEAFLHDPLTVWALVDESPFGFEELRVVPTIERGVFRPHVVPADAGIGTPMRVATGLQADAASRAIAERLLSL